MNADDLLKNAVAALSRRLPEWWAEYDADGLTDRDGVVDSRLRLPAAGRRE